VIQGDCCFANRIEADSGHLDHNMGIFMLMLDGVVETLLE
jgi:hypothetical protein